MKLVAAIALALAAGPALGEEQDAEMGRRVQALLRAHQADVFGCVQLNRTQANGELLVRVFVGAGGRAERPEVLKDQSGGGPLGGCLVEKVRGWDLSPLGAAEGDQLVFPLAFKPAPSRYHLRPERDERVIVSESTSGAAPRAQLSRWRAVRNERFAFDGRPVETAVFAARGKARVTCGEPVSLAAGDVAWCRVNPKAVELDAGAELVVVESAARSPDGRMAGGVARARQIAPLAIAGGRGRARLYLDGAGLGFALDELTCEAGVKIPPHQHEGSDEILYVLGGRGTTGVAGESFAVAAGDAIYVPAGAEHWLTVDEKLTAVQVYAPGGPEQRFKNLNDGSKK